MLCIELKSVKAFAKQTFPLGPRDQELHLDTVDLSAESFDWLGRVDLDLLQMDGEAQPGQQVDRELSIPDGLERCKPSRSHRRCMPYIAPAVGGDIE